MAAAAAPPANSAKRSPVVMFNGIGTQSADSLRSVNGRATTRKPTATAIPPARGIGLVFTRRAFGRSTTPYRFIVRRTIGVSANAIRPASVNTTMIGK